MKFKKCLYNADGEMLFTYDNIQWFKMKDDKVIVMDGQPDPNEKYIDATELNCKKKS